MDNKVIRAASGGDKNAMQAIYVNYIDTVWNTVYMMTGNQQLTEDSVAETFIRIFRNLKKFQGRSSLKTWIYRIAVNTTVNMLKRENIRRNLPLFESISGKNNETVHKTEVDIILETLKPKERFLLVMKEIEGYSFKQLSEILNSNENTLKTRHRRIIEKLRKEQLYAGKYT